MGNALSRLLGRGKEPTETAATEQGPADGADAAAEDADVSPSAATPVDQADKLQKPAKAAKAPKAPKAHKDKAAGNDGRSHNRFGAWLGRPMTSFHLIIAIAGLLTILGLIMVLSASGVRSYGAEIGRASWRGRV